MNPDRWISNGGLGLIWEFGPSEALGVTLAVGLKIYDSESSFSSDRVNRPAVPGRPIGDQRRGFDLLLPLLPGGTAGAVRAARWRRSPEDRRRRHPVIQLGRH